MRSAIRNQVVSYILIINLIGSLFAPSVVAAIGTESRVLLCTSQGYQWVTVKNEQEFTLKGNFQGSEHCIYCLTSNDDQEAVSFIPTVLYLSLSEVATSIRQSVESGTTRYPSHAQPRAPPIFI